MSRTTLPYFSYSLFIIDPKYSGDGNCIDLAFAVHAFARGTSEDAIRAAIQTRDLSKKGAQPRQLAYMERTITKAREHLKRCPLAR